MDDWLKQLNQTLEQLATETEQWVEATVEAVADVSDTLADEVETALSPMLTPLADELGRNLGQWIESVEPWADAAVVNLGTWVEQATTPVNQVVDPWLQNRTRCIGCRNYHGQTYGDQDFICAIHPFGPDPEQESCPDYEAVWHERPGQ